ncbi:MAG: DUF2621 family protein [Planctomycetales bacterium]
MFYGVSHVCIPAASLQRSQEFYSQLLGIPVLEEHDDHVDLEGGGAVLRLVRDSDGALPKGMLRVQAGDFAEAVEHLLNHGVELLEPPARVGDREFTTSVLDPSGNTVTIWRKLSEDEYEQAPDLPTSCDWLPEAETILRDLLLVVPAMFRDMARKKAVRAAEALVGDGEIVRKRQMIQGYIRATPWFMRDRARQPLLDHGIDPAEFQEDFDA